MSKNWRPEVDAGDYFGHRQREFDIADRRPVARKPSDLAGMGPGVNAEAVRIVDFNDRLAQYDGYFSSARSLNGPRPEESGPDTGYDTNLYVGQVTVDASLGGLQEFTDLATGLVWRRTFVRAPLDETFLTWGEWIAPERRLRPVGELTMFLGTEANCPDGWLVCNGDDFDPVQYPDLLAFLGGITLPDLRGKFPMVADAVDTLGSVGGSNTAPDHTHEFTHNHSFSDGGHDHSISDAGGVEVQAGTGVTVANAGHAHGGSTGTRNANGTTDASTPSETQPQSDLIDNRPAFYAVNFIIRAVGD